MASESFVLDSFAVLALLTQEPGSAEVARILRHSSTAQAQTSMSWVNVGEVMYIVERRWGMERVHATLGMMEAIPVEFVTVGQELAMAAGHIKATYPIAYANAFSAALAQLTGATLVTGDPEFRPLDKVLDILWLPQR